MKNNKGKKQKGKHRKELSFFIVLAICAIMFCSNFGLCGVAGDHISEMFFGLFGFLQYILPVYIFALFAVGMSGDKKKIGSVLWLGLMLVLAAMPVINPA